MLALIHFAVNKMWFSRTNQQGVELYMKIIDRIEVNYFRSVYSISANNLGDLNVLIGKNDAGKSNVLKALNLFFNNQLGYDEDIDFLQDVNHLRQNEAREAKGRLTIWIKVHFNNVENCKTLPEKFFIKKSWNRYTDDPEISSDVENKQSLTRFQNKIKFHYIPAIKEKDIFSYYLYLLYETLSEREDIEFAGPADALSSAVNSSIIDLTGKIKSALAVNSRVQIPNDLESIFERLEFFTDQDGYRIPLSRRSDGLQVRHIPHILSYISQNNKKLNIWGYEEPENSLELTNAHYLAREFEDEFSTTNQIFLTSHSPAFYSLSNPGSRHFLIKKSITTSLGSTHSVTSLEDLKNTQIADTEMGVAQLISDRSKEIFTQIENLERINTDLSKLSKPIILTEGKTDTIILKAAWEKLYPDKAIPFDIKSCDLGGTPDNQENAGADELKEILESTTKDHNPVRFGIFDGDAKGRECFKNLKKHVRVAHSDTIKVNSNKRSGAILLSYSKWGSPYDDYISDSHCIEMMFPYELIPEGHVDFHFFMGSKKLSKSRGDEWIKNIRSSPDLFEDIPFRVVPKFDGKLDLAKFFVEANKTNFHSFDLLFSDVEKALALTSKIEVK